MLDEARWEKIASREFKIRNTPGTGTLWIIKHRKKGLFATYTMDSNGVEEYGDGQKTEEAVRVQAEKEIGANVLSKTVLYFTGDWQ